MPNTTTTATLFNPELVREVFNNVTGHSSIVTLSQQKPIPFTGNDIFVFTMDGEASIVGEGENTPPGNANTKPVSVVPIKIQYQHRVSDEFMRASEERALEMLKEFSVGFTKKIARAVDIMAFHGVNPADLQPSAKIGDNHFDTVQTVTYVEGKPEDALEDAVAITGENDITGYAFAKAFASALGRYKENGISQYPEFKLGANPGKLAGMPCDVNSTVNKGNDKALAYVGDFKNKFRWGYADQIPLEVIPFGDPDGLGDLKRTNMVVLRATAFVGFAIMDKDAFARIENGV